MLQHQTKQSKLPYTRNAPSSSHAGTNVAHLVHLLSQTYELLQNSRVPDSIVAQFFTQIFYFIDALLMNALITRKELCTCSNGFQTKLELSDLEAWIQKNGTFMNSVKYPTFVLLFTYHRDELNPIIQAATLLVMDKSALGDKEVLTNMCPNVNFVQVKRLLENFLPDQLYPDPVSPKVKEKLENLVSKSGNQLLLELPPYDIRPLSLSYLTPRDFSSSVKSR